VCFSFQYNHYYSLPTNSPQIQRQSTIRETQLVAFWRRKEIKLDAKKEINMEGKKANKEFKRPLGE